MELLCHSKLEIKRNQTIEFYSVSSSLPIREIGKSGVREHVCSTCGKGHRWKDELHKCEQKHAGLFRLQYVNNLEN